ncbi:MAG: hypothetical protein ACXITV_05180 [Luteibaculaceae bacterium]
MLKPSIAILLLFSLFGPFIIPVGYYKLETKKIKRSIKWKIIEGIDKNELVYMEFTSHQIENDLRWVHSKEFEFEGEMYDIVEYRIVGDSHQMWLWWDYEETELNQRVKRILADFLETNTNQKEGKSKIVSFFKTLFIPSLPAKLPTFYNQKSEQKIADKPVFYRAPFLSILAPPPWHLH